MPKLTAVNARQLIKFFEGYGFVVSKRRPGDHILMRKPGCQRPLVIPDYREIPPFIVLNNLRTAGIDRETFMREIND